MNKPTRCINVDWLEVYALEPISQPHNAEYFRACGFEVMEREYGTKIYEEMFKLMDNQGHPFIEVRRKPKNDGVLQINSTHIRFDNRYCYVDNACELMAEFLHRYSYTFVSIFRLDICLDFERFDSGDEPQKFVKRYIGHKYAKINQSEATARFNDEWERREFNSLSWGAKTSDISTKLYNKTLELYDESLQAFKKPYIIQSWFESGLIDDPIKVIKLGKDGKTYRPTIWRLEFSIRSHVKGWLEYHPDGKEKKILSVRHGLEQYPNRAALLPVFNLLQQHYFHFKKHQPGKPKYECSDKILFDFNSEETFYRVLHPASPKKPDALILRLRRYLSAYIEHKWNPELVKAANSIIDELTKEDALRLCTTQFNNAELEALKFAIKERLEGNKEDPTVLMEFFQKHLTDIF